uniref:Uncharacterized protein n=1 Tax=Ananas comosus var. bracteatus TaxID=296719 RepID=A0A6V7P7P6_ANACO|nr:unnamed protein product [Ananas comosus var. bracteatus]
MFLGDRVLYSSSKPFTLFTVERYNHDSITRQLHIMLSFVQLILILYGILMEVFVDPNHVGSFIFELLDLKEEVRDNESAVRFLCDTASEQDAEETMVLEHSGNLELGGLHSGDAPTIATTAVGQMVIFLEELLIKYLWAAGCFYSWLCLLHVDNI